MSEVEEIADTLTFFRDGRMWVRSQWDQSAAKRWCSENDRRKLERFFRPSRSRLPRPADSGSGRSVLGTDFASNQPERRQRRNRRLGGLDGQGQGELLFALFGVLRGVRGKVRMTVGKSRSRVRPPRPARRIAWPDPEDRKTEGLILADVRCRTIPYSR